MSGQITLSEYLRLVAREGRSEHSIIEVIRAEIERRTYNAHEMPDSRPDKQFYEGKDVAYGEILAFLDTLPEQPKLKPMNIPSAGGGMSTIPPSHKLYVKPELLIGLDDENAADKKAVKEIVKTVHKEITRQVKEMVGKQPVEGLNAEIENYFGNIPDDTDKIDIARHFYELGCRHTAVMYDDIEYERQRAEETEPSGDLEEVAKEYTYANMYDGWDYERIYNAFIAGAEWRREQMMEEWLKDRDGCFWDGVEEGKKAMEEQMMEKAVEAEVNTYEDLAAGKSWAEFVVEMPTNSLGDKVTVIVIPEEK